MAAPQAGHAHKIAAWPRNPKSQKQNRLRGARNWLLSICSMHEAPAPRRSPPPGGVCSLAATSPAVLPDRRAVNHPTTRPCHLTKMVAYLTAVLALYATT